jgi:hypothetical protein
LEGTSVKEMKKAKYRKMRRALNEILNTRNKRKVTTGFKKKKVDFAGTMLKIPSNSFLKEISLSTTAYKEVSNT